MASSTSTLALSGSWQFQLDPDGHGLSQEWFQKDSLSEQIRLPGSLQEQGFGDDPSTATKWTGQIVDRAWFTDARYAPYREPGHVKVPFWLTPEKHYVGKAWYQRAIEVPESWNGRHLHLHLERPHWETHVWVDGRPVGRQNSLSTPHEYSLGPLKPGEHRLTILVDNSMIVNVGENAHSVSDHTQSNWNGITGRIEVRASDPVRIADVQVYPDRKRSEARVVAVVENQAGFPVRGELSLRLNEDPDSRVPFDSDKTTFTVEMTIPTGSAATWDEFSPQLNNLLCTLETSDSRDSCTVTFGIRDFKSSGTQLSINDRLIFLRGTLECCVFPLTGYPPTDEASWERIITRAREYGLNHLRFHSWCPPEAAFRAADRMGFIFSIECAAWATVGDGKPIDQWIYAEGERIMKEYGNHPSFCMLLYGNEPHGKKHSQYLARLVDHWKATDDRRLYSSGAGWPAIEQNQFHIVPEPRIQLWGAGLKSRINAAPPETTTDYSDYINKHPVPVISHEIGQWCVYPNFAERAKYTGVLKAANFDIFHDFLSSAGMADQAEAFLIASGKLQALCYKEDIESALRTPGMAGFELLGLNDFPGQGTALVGVVDPFWDDKGYITGPEFRRFCDVTVPLAHLSKRVFTADEELTGTISIAHFGPKPLRDARPNWNLSTTEGRPISGGELQHGNIPVGNGTVVGTLRVPLNNAPAPGKLILTVAVDDKTSNSWDVWVYPKKQERPAAPSVLVVEELNQEAVGTLKHGGKVLLIPKPGSVEGDDAGPVPPGFSSIFWNTAWTQGQAPHTLGLLCNPAHPALKEFPTESHSNWHWWYLIHDSQIMIIDILPQQLRPVIQVIDDWVTARRLALAFECQVESGKLLVCGANLLSKSQNPVKKQLLASLLDYMQGESFAPKQEVTFEQLSTIVKPANSAGHP